MAIDKNNLKLPVEGDCWLFNAARMEDGITPVFSAAEYPIDSADKWKIFSKITMVNGKPKIWESGETADTTSCGLIIQDCEQLLWAFCGAPGQLTSSNTSLNPLPDGYNTVYFMLDPQTLLNPSAAESSSNPKGFYFQNDQYLKFLITAPTVSNAPRALCGHSPTILKGTASYFTNYVYCPIGISNSDSKVIIQGLQLIGTSLFKAQTNTYKSIFRNIYFKDWLWTGSGIASALVFDAPEQINASFLDFENCDLSLGLKSMPDSTSWGFEKIQNYTSITWTNCSRNFTFFNQTAYIQYGNYPMFGALTQRCTTKVNNLAIKRHFTNSYPLIKNSQNSSWNISMDYFESASTNASQVNYMLYGSGSANVFLKLKIKEIQGTAKKIGFQSIGGSNLIVFDYPEGYDSTNITSDTTVKFISEPETTEDFELMSNYGFFVHVIN